MEQGRRLGQTTEEKAVEGELKKEHEFSFERKNMAKSKKNGLRRRSSQRRNFFFF